MKIVIGTLLSTVAILILVTTTNAIAQTRSNGIQDRFAEVNGLRLHYLVAGNGNPVILLHGYAETSHMWRPLMVELARLAG